MELYTVYLEEGLGKKSLHVFESPSFPKAFGSEGFQGGLNAQNENPDFTL